MLQARLLVASVLRGGARAASARRLTVAAGALALALGIYVLAVSSNRFGDAPLFLLVVPMALSAFAYGLRGGIVSTLVGSLLATSWWVERGYPGGAAWYCSRIVTYVLIGTVLGRLIDSRRVLQRALEQHMALSLDMIGTANFEGYFIRVNPAFTFDSRAGSEEELTSKPFLDFVHPDDRPGRLWSKAQTPDRRRWSRFCTSRTATAPRTAPTAGSSGRRGPTSRPAR